MLITYYNFVGNIFQKSILKSFKIIMNLKCFLTFNYLSSKLRLYTTKQFLHSKLIFYFLLINS